jgi:diguanylate cyclase (GGDEF)-like protein
MVNGKHAGTQEKLMALIEEHGGEDKPQLSSYVSSLMDEAKQWELDTLTGLHSRKYMDNILSEELGRYVRDRKSNPKGCLPVTLSVIDLDGFKGVNDTHGHLVGDNVLRDASIHFLEALDDAEAIRGVFGPLREGDVVARVGGDEFNFLMPQTSLQGGFHAMEKVKARIANQNDLGGVTVSAGVASSDIVGIPLLYDRGGRALIRNHAEYKRQNQGVPDGSGGNGETGSKKYNSMLGIMLDNVYGFMTKLNINPDSVNSDFEKIAVQLMKHGADGALYKAKENGRNRVYALGGGGFGTYSGNSWVPSGQ